MDHSIHTGHGDEIPDFSHHAGVIARGDGEWKDPSIWNLAMGSESVVFIPGPRNVTITGESASCHTVVVAGSLTFDSEEDTLFSCRTIQVLPGGSYSHITRKKSRVIFKPRSFGADDPQEYGGGFVAAGGSVRIQGGVVTPYVPMLRVDGAKGEIILSHIPIGWEPGGLLWLPGTEQDSFPFTHSWGQEYAVIKSLTENSDGTCLVLLAAPLQFDHKPFINAEDGSVVYFPDAVFTSRNIVYSPSNPLSSTGRAHFMIAGDAEADLSHFQLDNMGRTRNEPEGPTNKKGRYSLHIHGVSNDLAVEGWTSVVEGWTSVVEGVSVTNALKWGIAIHHSMRNLVLNNTVIGAQGAGFVCEDTIETGNVFRGNLAGAISGLGSFKGLGEPYDSYQLPVEGGAGSGFWINTRPGQNLLESNIAYNCVGFGIESYAHEPVVTNEARWPKTVRANHNRPEDWSRYARDVPFQEPFRDNFCHSCHVGIAVQGDAPEVWVKRGVYCNNSRFGAVAGGGHGGGKQVNWDGLSIYGDPSKINWQVSRSDAGGGAFHNGHYAGAKRIHNITAIGYRVGISTATPAGSHPADGYIGNREIVGGYLANADVNLELVSDFHYIGSADPSPKGAAYTWIDGVSSKKLGDRTRHLVASFAYGNDISPCRHNYLFLRNFTVVPGVEGAVRSVVAPDDWLQMFSYLQEPDAWMIPEIVSPTLWHGAVYEHIKSDVPEDRLTVKQAFEKYGRAPLGLVAPEGRWTHPAIEGVTLAFPIVPTEYTPLRLSEELHGSYRVDFLGVSGVAWDRNNLGDHVPLVLLVDGVAVMEFSADQFDPGQWEMGLGGSGHGYRVLFPEKVCDGMRHGIRVTFKDGRTLPDGDQGGVFTSIPRRRTKGEIPPGAVMLYNIHYGDFWLLARGSEPDNINWLSLQPQTRVTEELGWVMQNPSPGTVPVYAFGWPPQGLVQHLTTGEQDNPGGWNPYGVTGYFFEKPGPGRMALVMERQKDELPVYMLASLVETGDRVVGYIGVSPEAVGDTDTWRRIMATVEEVRAARDEFASAIADILPVSQKWVEKDDAFIEVCQQHEEEHGENEELKKLKDELFDSIVSGSAAIKGILKLLEENTAAKEALIHGMTPHAH